MLGRIRRHLSYANVMASIAVFVALGGGAYAAIKLPANSVGTKQLKKGAVTNAKLGKNSVAGSQVKDGSLTGADINLATLPKVPSADNATNASHATNADHATAATTAGGAPPTGAAGGDLSGTFPNPSVAVKSAVKASSAGSSGGIGPACTGTVNTTASTICSITVNVPRDGTIVLIPEVEWSNSSGTPSGYLWNELFEGATSLDGWDWDAGDTDTWFDTHQSHVYVGPVTGGSHTYDLKTKTNTGAADYYYGRITAMWFPSSL